MSIQWVVSWMVSRIFLRNSNGNLYVPYLNWSGDEWYLNFNRLDNDWNDNDRLVSCQSLRSLLSQGSFYLYSFIHPPIILPISARGVDRAVNLLVSSAFISHKSLIKNFSISNLVFSCLTVFSFSSFDW